MTAPLKRTSAQSRAAQPAHNVWVSANAGTGKTRVLVDRIARLLLDGARPEKILCLTFTKTGAAEMSDRISQMLGAWATLDDDALFADLHALIGGEPGENMLATARTLFARVLDVPGGLKIRTIHSFCESLIGRFPVEAGVAPHFSVIDERTAAELLFEARERILARTVQDPDGELAGALNHLAELVNEDDFTSLMRELTGKRARLGEVLRHYASQGGVGVAVTTLVGLEADEISEGTILAAALSDQALDKSALEAASDALARGAKTSAANATKLKHFLGLDLRTRTAAFAAHYAFLFVTQAGEPRKRLVTKGAEAGEDALAVEQARVFEILEKLRARATADATRSLLTVGQAMVTAYEHLKRVRAHLDYDDLIDTARSLLSTQDGVSWVHFKLDGGIDHILVDESQDTSPAQWDVVQNLAADFYAGLSRHEDQDKKPRTMFAVGDEKQSIYSFQGADPFEFGRMRDYFHARATGAKQTFSTVELIESFRTVPAVLRVVDRVFAQEQAADGLTFDGARVVHDTRRNGQAGLVEIWPTFKAEDSAEDDPWDAPLDYQNQRSPELRLASTIAATIKAWIKDGEMLTAENRAVRPGDILILVRRRARFAEAMVSSLKKHGIAVAGADRMVLTDQIGVMDLLAAGRFSVLPEDDLSLAEVLKSPLVGLDEDALFDLAQGRKAGLWAELSKRRDERADFTHAFDVLSLLLKRADFTPPYEFYADLLQDGGRKALIARLGLDAEDPIDEFLGLALDFERTHTPSLQGFLHWVTAGGTQIKRDMETQGNEVRVMTVHGAKGLEAPIVFLTDTCKTPDGRLDARVQWNTEHPQLLWSPYKDTRCQAFTGWSDAARTEREREYRRLLYVAMTRAKDRLYITGFEDSKGRADGCWYDLVSEAMDGLGEELPWLGDEVARRYETPQEVRPPEVQAKIEQDESPALPGWALQPAPKDATPARPLSPSRPEPEAPPAFGPFDDSGADRFKRGLLVHKLLETLPNLDPAHRPDAAKAWLAQPGHDLSADQQAEILGETLAVLDNPELADLFSPSGLAEVSICGVLGDQVVSARLDRLAISDDLVTVIDFKTNRPAPTDPNDVPEAYLRQMATYRALLAGIYPTKRIRAVLLWTDGPHAMVLDDAVLRAYAPPTGPA